MAHRLIDQGFRNLGLIGELLRDGLPLAKELDGCGVYAITTPAEFEPSFITPDDARTTGNVMRPWGVEQLEEKWVTQAGIVYYGLAGDRSMRTLRERLGDLVKHGSGKTTDRGPHTGGEILWQVRGYSQFAVWVLATGGPPQPRKKERELIQQFLEKHGKMPFANRRP